ncbi:MAG: patatin-like phospholipase family protein [Tepidisphaeraceae bacterium]
MLTTPAGHSPHTSLRRGAALAMLSAALLCGCADTRPARSLADLLADRAASDAQFERENARVMQKLIAEARAKFDAPASQPSAVAPPTIDILIISGGGDWGAFGAGVLKGWGTCTTNPRPCFDIVTGVSTGALIAPFAFLGDDASINTVVQLYRHPQSDWVQFHWPLYFWPNNRSFATIPGLERAVSQSVDERLVQGIAAASRAGRSLLINTTDLDNASMFVWDVGLEAERTTSKQQIDRIHQILLASSGIPVAFPFREIDGDMYVDGGISSNVLYGGRIAESESFPAAWQKRYPTLPVPRTRFWVIFNNQIRPLPQVTAPRWPALVARTTEIATRSATLTSMRHLFAQVEISRLTRRADIEVRYIAVPDQWAPPKPGAFVPETMNALADLGERMGADPQSWISEPP